MRPEEERSLPRLYWTIVRQYSTRKMSFDRDSLNALLGVLNVWEMSLLPSGCVWGLPMAALPRSIGWLHPSKVQPRRRIDLPSWSWVGWQGGVNIYNMLVEHDTIGEPAPIRDMTVEYVGINGKELTVEGWVATLDIRTEPFSEVMVPGTDELMGMVEERDFNNPVTLPTGRYPCLVEERHKLTRRKDKPFQRLVMIVLDRTGQLAERRTIIRLTTPTKGDFMCLKPVKRRLALV